MNKLEQLLTLYLPDYCTKIDGDDDDKCMFIKNDKLSDLDGRNIMEKNMRALTASEHE